MSEAKRWVIPVIVIAQFSCTSVWFAGNAVIAELIKNFHLTDNALGYLTSIVQFGFITGTLCYALLMIADRFKPSAVFSISAIAAALFNEAIIFGHQTLSSILLCRFLTGFFLAGIYPVGMKIAADHYDKDLGKALGFLVGALVLGTAFPHLLKSFTFTFYWKTLLMSTSLLCFFGGLLMLIVPNGRYRKKGQQLNIKMITKILSVRKFRAASFGYFGHMWELYAFWAFVPIIISTYQNVHPCNNLNISFLSFIIIAVGAITCVIAGYFSQKYVAKKIASIALGISGLCCLFSPVLFFISSSIFLIIFLIIWGMAVIADSPMFTTLIAQNAMPEYKGTALTLVTCIGFSITIISIQLLNYLFITFDIKYIYLLLAIGPLFGLISLRKFSRQIKFITKNH